MPEGIGNIVRSSRFILWEIKGVLGCGGKSNEKRRKGLSYFLWIKKGFSGDPFIFLEGFWRSLDFESWNLEFGFWSLDSGSPTQKNKKQYIAYRGGRAPEGELSPISFWHFGT